MTDKIPPDLLEVEDAGGVTVVRFTRRTILDPTVIETLGEHLQALVKDQGCRRLVLNFARVESVTSAMLGKLISLYNDIHGGGGRMVFTGVDPFLLQIFRLCNLPAGIPIHASEADAVQALA
jgi:anti-anti-sigma factor